jgi:hypothetical protein
MSELIFEAKAGKLQARQVPTSEIRTDITMMFGRLVIITTG